MANEKIKPQLRLVRIGMIGDGDFMGINHSSSGRRCLASFSYGLKLLVRNCRSNSDLILTMLIPVVLLGSDRICPNLSTVVGRIFIHMGLIKNPLPLVSFELTSKDS